MISFIFAVGIHPENAYELNDSALQEIEHMAISSDKVRAIGEIGLDYYWDENLQEMCKRRLSESRWPLRRSLAYQ